MRWVLMGLWEQACVVLDSAHKARAKPAMSLQHIFVAHHRTSLQHFRITQLFTLMFSFYKDILLDFLRGKTGASLSWSKQHALFGLSKGVRGPQRGAGFKAFRMNPHVATGSQWQTEKWSFHTLWAMLCNFDTSLEKQRCHHPSRLVFWHRTDPPQAVYQHRRITYTGYSGGSCCLNFQI